jgi:3,4-dihydroxy 2-butanone 4-phosphate synthase/GTP cyclohydrolase II
MSSPPDRPQAVSERLRAREADGQGAQRRRSPGAGAHQQYAWAFAGIEEAVEELRAGRAIVVVDDPDRENEGDLTAVAEKITPEMINFMARHGRGLICAALTEDRLDELRLPLMTEDNTSPLGTAFCVSVDAREGVTTGVSAADRARTIRTLVAPGTQPSDLVTPGHTLPLRARRGGVLARAGQTEASVDLARIAGFAPAGVICEIMNEDGTMARVPQLAEFCREHGLKMITVADLIRYRLTKERYIHRAGEMPLRTRHGNARLIAFRSELDQEHHSALVFGSPNLDEPVLVRVQTHCVPAIMGSLDCECAAAAESALAAIASAGSGIFIYLHQNTPGYTLQDNADGSTTLAHGLRTVPAGRDHERVIQRQVGVGAQILCDLGVRQIRLLTDHPRRVAALEGFGLKIVEQVPLTAKPKR